MSARYPQPPVPAGSQPSSPAPFRRSPFRSPPSGCGGTRGRGAERSDRAGEERPRSADPAALELRCRSGLRGNRTARCAAAAAGGCLHFSPSDFSSIPMQLGSAPSACAFTLCALRKERAGCSPSSCKASLSGAAKALSVHKCRAAALCFLYEGKQIVLAFLLTSWKTAPQSAPIRAGLTPCCPDSLVRGCSLSPAGSLQPGFLCVLITRGFGYFELDAVFYWKASVSFGF